MGPQAARSSGCDAGCPIPAFRPHPLSSFSLLSLAGAGLPAGFPSPQGPHEVGRYPSPTVMVRSGAVGVVPWGSCWRILAPPPFLQVRRLTRGGAVVSRAGFCRLQGASGRPVWKPVGCPVPGEAARGPTQGSAGPRWFRRHRAATARLPARGQHWCGSFRPQGTSHHVGPLRRPGGGREGRVC